MAGECTETTTNSSSIHNWWPDHHHHLSSSWSTTSNNLWVSEHNNNNSESSGEESVSISTSFTTNASNHSGLSVESSRKVLLGHSAASAAPHEFIGEAVSDNYLWNQVLLTGGSNGELHNSQEFGEHLLDGMPSKNTPTEILFDPACDYTKKMDNSCLFSSVGSINNIEKQLNFLSDSLVEGQLRVPKLSNLIGNCSITPQDGHIHHQFEPCRSDLVTLNSIMKDPFCDLGQEKQDLDRNYGSISRFGDDVKMDDEYGRSFLGYNKVGNPVALGNTILRDKSRYNSFGLPNNIPFTNSRSFTEVLASTGHLSRPPLDSDVSKPILKTLDLSGFRKQVFQTSPFTSPKLASSTVARNNRRTLVQLSGGKKRRSEENPGAVLKKPKQSETTTISSAKMQVPKPKLAEKITALQQMVSPFGKTDTASVLWEAIGYIRFLQEQIKLLTSPYMKGTATKDLWGGLDRKDRGDGKLDLKSRGLCIIPVSRTPQVCRENSGSDYLTPMYRGCLYR